VFNKKIDPPYPYFKRKVKKGDGQIIIDAPQDILLERKLLQEDTNFLTGWSFVKPQ